MRLDESLVLQPSPLDPAVKPRDDVVPLNSYNILLLSNLEFRDGLDLKRFYNMQQVTLNATS